MRRNSTTAFVNRLGDFYTQQYGFAPAAGRTLGYLSICSPASQSINDIAKTLQISRTAVVKAVKLLEQYHLVQRERPIGSRVDLVNFTSEGVEKNGFDANLYRQQAQLAREALKVAPQLSQTQRESLEKIASLGNFLADRVPGLFAEWQQEFNKEKEK